MRDKKRIKPFLRALEKEWMKVPDWRFGQLVLNVLSENKSKAFVMEDAEMLEAFEEYFERNGE